MRIISLRLAKNTALSSGQKMDLEAELVDREARVAELEVMEVEFLQKLEDHPKC